MHRVETIHRDTETGELTIRELKRATKREQRSERLRNSTARNETKGERARTRANLRWGMEE